MSMNKSIIIFLISHLALLLAATPHSLVAEEHKPINQKDSKSASKPKPPKVIPKPAPEPEVKPIWQPRVGVFITSLHSFDLRNQSYNVAFWTWFVHPYDDYKPELTTEIVNAHTYNREKTFVEEKENNVKWAQAKFTGKIAHQWDVSNFPFDRQVLQIIMEDSELDSSGVQYVADTHNSKVDQNVHLSDWKIVDFNIQAPLITYQTTYGDPDLVNGDSTYSRVTVSITIERQGARLFFNMFLALYVAFILSALAFFIPLENTSARLGLATASIFSAIGNKYVVDSMLPPTTTLTLVDKIQILTFLFIGIGAIVTVIHAYLGSEREKLAQTINKCGEVMFPLSYITLNVYWIYQAIQ